MSKISFVAGLLAILLLATSAFAHTLFITVYDNEDGTISAEGMYSTGAVGSNHEVRLEAVETGKVLWKGRTDDVGEVTVDKPKVPYNVIIDGGPGHVAEEQGPM